MTGPERDDLIFLFAAGALEGDERDAVEALVASEDPDVAAEVARADGELARLALHVEPEAPPAALKGRLLARVHESAAGADANGQAGPFGRLRPSGFRTSGLLAAALAAVALAAVVAAVSERTARQESELLRAPLEERVAAQDAALRSAQTQLDDLTTDVEELDDEMSQQEQAFGEAEQMLSDARRSLAMLADPEVEMLELAGVGAHTSASARVYWDHAEWRCYLRAQGLPSLGDTRVYALWLGTESGERIRVGSFDSADGAAELMALMPRDLEPIISTSVSLEPDDRLADAPRGPVVLHGETAASAPTEG